MYQALGRQAEAEQLLRRSLAIHEKASKSEHQNVATTLLSLAALYREQDRHADAELLLQCGLAVYEKALGPEHPNVATALSRLAALYRDQGRHAEAEQLSRRSFAITEKALGYEHSSVGAALNCQTARDFDPPYRRAILTPPLSAFSSAQGRVAERSGATEGLSSGSRLDADRGSMRGADPQPVRRDPTFPQRTPSPP
jgi:tetratricopeptide (TPR) repeat protein